MTIAGMPPSPRPPRTVVTGGAGFVGTHVVDALLVAGHDVVVVDDLRHRSSRPLDPRASLVELDLAGPGAWDPLESTCRHASLSIL